jgi:hypothetical protein
LNLEGRSDARLFCSSNRIGLPLAFGKASDRRELSPKVGASEADPDRLEEILHAERLGQKLNGTALHLSTDIRMSPYPVIVVDDQDGGIRVRHRCGHY